MPCDRNAYGDGVVLEDVLRANDHRVTRARRIVWDVLGASDRHLNAREIAERSRRRDPKVNPSSVYRALTLFAELDLVRESRLEGDASTWEIAHDDRVIHLVCRHCGTVEHHDASTVNRLRAQLAREAGFDVDEIDVRARGVCARCTQQA
ncbi:MAG: Fur family transcriptional regulator [Acidimicrobiia bacterium]|nr:Fur family transcriptional regulator [Acidimicrobiia bacterium]